MSFNIALSGINAINNQLTTISHNIANTGTYGFKSGRANFATMISGTQANGAYIGSVTQSIGVGGGVFATGRGLDAAIDGNGFFVTKDDDGSTLFTRVGIFQRDADGYLVDAFGRRAQGYAEGGAYGDLQIPVGVAPAKASDRLDYAGNLSADWEAPAQAVFDKDDDTSFNHTVSSAVYDSLGRQHIVTQYFVKAPSPSTDVTVHYAMNGERIDGSATLSFDTHGRLTSPTAPTPLNLGTPDGAAPLTLAIHYAGATQVAGESSTMVNRDNGHAAGVPGEPTLDSRGNVVVQYSNGQKRTLGTIALATFPSPDGLVAAGDTAWRASSTSGNALLGTAGAGALGKLVTSSLELSNADVTKELVDMMTAQRNYQANSKVLSTENQMMQALMQAL